MKREHIPRRALRSLSNRVFFYPQTLIDLESLYQVITHFSSEIHLAKTEEDVAVSVRMLCFYCHSMLGAAAHPQGLQENESDFSSNYSNSLNVPVAPAEEDVQ